MTANDETQLCIACKAYLEHYPIMEGEWECQHEESETAFMQALADHVHGPHPAPEFVDPGWRAAQFLDDAELAFDCGPAPYEIRMHHNNDNRWSTLFLVNGRHLIGCDANEGESEYIADIAGVLVDADGQSGDSQP